MPSSCSAEHWNEIIKSRVPPSELQLGCGSKDNFFNIWQGSLIHKCHDCLCHIIRWQELCYIRSVASGSPTGCIISPRRSNARRIHLANFHTESVFRQPEHGFVKLWARANSHNPCSSKLKTRNPGGALWWNTVEVPLVAKYNINPCPATDVKQKTLSRMHSA